MKRSNSILIGLIVASLVVGGGGYYWYTQQQPQKYTGPVEKITVAGAKSGALVYVAQAQGYFTENGLDVTIKDYAAGKLAQDAFLAGEADIATSAEFVFVSESFEHNDLRILGSVATADISKVIVRRDKGITEPTDLRGKTIGVTRKSAGEFYLGRFLTSNGLSFTDVKIHDLKPADIEEAMINGTIDAALTWEPHIFNIKTSLQDNAIVWPGQSGQDFYFILIAKEGWLMEHADAVERFMRAVVQAEQYTKENDGQAAQILASRFGLAPEEMEVFWPDHRWVVSLSQALIIAMEDEARWRIANELTDVREVPNYLDHIYPDALEEVKPSAVTIIG